MTLRKLTVDNSIKRIPQNDQTQSISGERDSKPNTLKNISLPCKQNKNFSQDFRKRIPKTTAEGFKIIKG